MKFLINFFINVTTIILGVFFALMFWDSWVHAQERVNLIVLSRCALARGSDCSNETQGAQVLESGRVAFYSLKGFNISSTHVLAETCGLGGDVPLRVRLSRAVDCAKRRKIYQRGVINFFMLDPIRITEDTYFYGGYSNGRDGFASAIPEEEKKSIKLAKLVTRKLRK